MALKERNKLIERKNKNGTAYIIPVTVHKKQRKIYLPLRYTKQQAEKIRFYVMQIAPLTNTGTKPDPVLQAWIDTLSDELREKLENAGLIEQSKRVTLGELWNLFIDDAENQVKRENKKASTVGTYETARKRFFRFFEENLDVDDLTVDDCEEWKHWLFTEGFNGGAFSKATVATSLKRCRSIWNWAVEKGYCGENPFLKVKIPSMANDERLYFISRDVFRKVLDACPDQSLRVYLSLLRIGGLRAAEPKHLKWSDVNWEKGLLQVHSPKTERHEGKDRRIMPIFPELRVELEALFDQAKPEAEGGSPYILDQLQDRTLQSVRHRFERVLFNAGVELYPRLFQNLRSSLDTDLANVTSPEPIPAHVRAKWLGHSVKVSETFYLQVTDEHYKKWNQVWSVPFGSDEPSAEAHAEPNATRRAMV